MGKAFAPSGTATRNQATAEAMQQKAVMDRQRAELERQRGIAESQQVGALQDTLESETNRLARVFGTRALLAGSNSRPTVR